MYAALLAILPRRLAALAWIVLCAGMILALILFCDMPFPGFTYLRR
jgi:hypothetical protein